MENKIEKRIFKVPEFRLKKNEDGGNILEGYSAVFDSPSENMGWSDWEIREYVAQEAFTKVLKTSDCRGLFNHDINLILGRQSAKTLVLTQDDKGLFSRFILPGTTYANNLVISVERGDIKEQSFAFIVGKEAWVEDKENRISTRTILEISELYDTSPVTYPAYPDTSVVKRSLEKFRSQSGANSGDDKEALEDKALDRNIINLLF